MSNIGGMASGFNTDLTITQGNLGRVKFLASRGDLVNANTQLATVIANLTALKVILAAATQTEDLPSKRSLPDPWFNAPLPPF